MGNNFAVNADILALFFQEVLIEVIEALSPILFADVNRGAVERTSSFPITMNY